MFSSESSPSSVWATSRQRSTCCALRWRQASSASGQAVQLGVAQIVGIAGRRLGDEVGVVAGVPEIGKEVLDASKDQRLPAVAENIGERLGDAPEVALAFVLFIGFDVAVGHGVGTGTGAGAKRVEVEAFFVVTADDRLQAFRQLVDRRLGQAGAVALEKAHVVLTHRQHTILTDLLHGLQQRLDVEASGDNGQLVEGLRQAVLLAAFGGEIDRQTVLLVLPELAILFRVEVAQLFDRGELLVDRPIVDAGVPKLRLGL